MKLEVLLGENSYDIHIESGIRNRIFQMLEFDEKSDDKYVIFSDKNVYYHYKGLFDQIVKEANGRVFLYVSEAGEKSKHISAINKAYEFLVEKGINRKDTVIALGGGVVGDFAGFIASTYMRGIKFVQVPTTLLSQVDSSVGGKVAVNLDVGKNLVGSFYQPDIVLIDPEFLITLKDRYFMDGLAEVIKYGFIKEEKIIDILEKCEDRKDIMDNIQELIRISCEIKKDIVIEDEKESGIRAILNFGHTIAHSIEKLGNYSKYTHGEAVAIGMVKILEAGAKSGVTDVALISRARKLLESFALPVESEYTNEELYKNLLNDKKFEGQNIKLILVGKIGEAIIKKVNEKDLWEYLFD
ncbi:MAG: 3-dehydroquinate synthase [Firmicutes bacterium]|jgi:3-dehydroquinate synthase|nr:3-dehydroquinate synthase [Bacillota bacterium]